MATLRNAIQRIDPSPNRTTKLTLAANLLVELAEQKIALQKEELYQLLRTAGTAENPTVPVTNILALHGEKRAYVKADAGALVHEVTKAVKSFINGGKEEIINGIGALVAGGLEAILGAGMGMQTSMHSYYIIVDTYSIIRFDVMAWQRKIEAVGITEHIENALAITAVKSSVDVNKISFDVFLQIYKHQLDKLNIEGRELLEFIEEAKRTFELLRDPSSTTSRVASVDATLLMPTEINFTSSIQPIVESSVDYSSFKTYSFRLAYEVYNKDEYIGTVKTNWVVYYKGDKHNIKPSSKDVDNYLIVLTGEVDTWCEAKGITPPTLQAIRANYGLEIKSGRG